MTLFGRPFRLTLVGLLSVASVLGTSSTPATAAFPLFLGARVPIGPTPGALEVVDLNHDGAVDLVTCDATLSQVSVNLGTGDGHFGPRATYPAATGAGAFAIADVNGDGESDVVTVSANLNTLSVLIGDGAGHFGPKTDYTTGNIPQGVAVGDLNGDGRADLVSANYSANTISVLLRTNTWSYLPKADFACGLNPTAIALADLNHDGKLDAVVAKDVGYAAILLGNGNGTFGPLSNVNTVGASIAVVVVDLNSDSHPDLVLANHNDNMLSVLHGYGDGNFALRIGHVVGSSPRSLQVVEPTGSFGRRILVGALATVVSTFPVNANGLLGARTDYVVRYNDSQLPGPLSLARSAQVNGDGALDLVTVTPAEGCASVFFGDAAGAWGYPPMPSVMAVEDPSLVDLDADGDADLVIKEFWQDHHFNPYGDLIVMLRQANGTLSTPSRIALQAWSGGLAVGDFDGDGNPDAAVPQLGSRIDVLRGNGTGGFTGSASTPFSHSSADLTAGDFDGDGDLDLIVGARVLLGNGNGTFTPGSTLPYPAYPGQYVTAQFDGDADLDLAIANRAQNRVEVLLGNGDGTFVPPVSYATGAEPVKLAIADLDGDGERDLVTANLAGASVSALRGRGDSTFEPRLDFPTGSGALAVAAGDVDGDRVPDWWFREPEGLQCSRGMAPSRSGP